MFILPKLGDKKVGSVDSFGYDCRYGNVGVVGIGCASGEDCTDGSDFDFLFCHITVHFNYLL